MYNNGQCVNRLDNVDLFRYMPMDSPCVSSIFFFKIFKGWGFFLRGGGVFCSAISEHSFNVLKKFFLARAETHSSSKLPDVFVLFYFLSTP